MYFGLNVIAGESVELIAGESVELLCNTSLTTDIMWTYDNDDDGYVQYVYWNGRVDDDRPRLSIKATSEDIHSLVIATAEQKDSGLYNCYDGEGTRKVGYQLSIAGT